MAFLCDWIFIIFATYISYKSYKQVVFNRNSPVGYFVVLVIYIFCCLPILLNYLLGVPEYRMVYWYKVFLPAMESEEVSIIYDFYIFIAIYTLYYSARNNRIRAKVTQVQDSSICNPYFYYFLIGLPFLYVSVTGKLTSLIVYTTLKIRGFSETENNILNYLVLLSIYAICQVFFSKKLNGLRILTLLILSFALAWIQGKRFIIAVMGILYLFFYTRMDISIEKRMRLFRVLPISLLVLVVFSGIYLAIVKPFAETNFTTVYDMLRVDFGRDDVIKYVIYQEFFKKNHILDYPFQTILSMVLIFIPRAIWPNKPYQHYMYLTSSILQTPLNRIPAGTTPSWYEMCLCNCSYFGFLLGIISIPVICNVADNLRTVKARAVTFLLVLVLLTQCIDVYLIFVVLFVAYYVENKILKGKHILL